MSGRNPPPYPAYKKGASGFAGKTVPQLRKELNMTGSRADLWKVWNSKSSSQSRQTKTTKNQKSTTLPNHQLLWIWGHMGPGHGEPHSAVQISCDGEEQCQTMMHMFNTISKYYPLKKEQSDPFFRSDVADFWTLLTTNGQQTPLVNFQSPEVWERFATSVSGFVPKARLEHLKKGVDEKKDMNVRVALIGDDQVSRYRKYNVTFMPRIDSRQKALQKL